MKKCCKNCKKHFICNYFVPFPDQVCSDFEFAKKKEFIVIHYSCLSRKFFIVGFTDTLEEGNKLVYSNPRFCSRNHRFYVCRNTPDSQAFKETNNIKDNALLNICNNVATSLALAEFHMLSKRYFKSKNCFDSAKSMIADACNILDNY